MINQIICLHPASVAVDIFCAILGIAGNTERLLFYTMK